MSYMKHTQSDSEEEAKKEKGVMIITEGGKNCSTPPFSKEENTENDKNYGRTIGLYNEKLLGKQLRNHFITIPQSEQDFAQLYESVAGGINHLKYLLIAREEHEDGGKHYHMMVKTTAPSTVKSIHKIIMSVDGDIGGSINYQKVETVKAVETYIKKGGDYKETGTISTQKYNAQNKRQLDIDLNEIYTNDENTENNLKLIMDRQPAYYTQYHAEIKAQLEEKENREKNTKKWEAPKHTIENTKLRPYQQRIWEEINRPPKNRRIIWVCGRPNSGKSFMFNYIQENYEYGIYSAGSTASMDNAVYGYEEQGAVAWDIPKNYDFETYGDHLSSTIEKFSDFGQRLTSRKYKGKTCKALGHVIVFSNRKPLEQLAHRDILLIETDEDRNETEKLKTYGIVKKMSGNGKWIWAHTFTQNQERGTRYYHNKEDLPEEIKRQVYNL